MDFKDFSFAFISIMVITCLMTGAQESGHVVTFEKSVEEQNFFQFGKELGIYMNTLNFSEYSDIWSYKEFQRLASLAKMWNKEKDFELILHEFRELSKHNKTRLPYDPDAVLNTSALIKSKGYISEEHSVTTEDGFILLLVRVKPANPAITDKTRLPVLMLHGLLSSSDCYVNNLKNESLAFVLAEMGFDVWLGNVRGNRYSSRHQRLHPNEKLFWDWSLDEMGRYDIPAMVDYVLQETGHEKLDYIGHSQGTTNLICSVIIHGDPFAQKINKFIALAPAVFISHTKSYMRYITRAARIIQLTWDLVDDGDFFSHDGILGLFGQKYCYKLPYFCWDTVDVLAGPRSSHSNWTRIPVYMSHVPAGTSTRNMVHWAQQIEAGDSFSFYDFGTRWLNYLHYHQAYPPKYDLSKFKVPTFGYLGINDWVITPTDGAALLEKLPNIQWVKVLDVTHLDFVWGYDIAPAYLDMAELLLN